jgi:serine protease Do
MAHRSLFSLLLAALIAGPASLTLDHAAGQESSVSVNRPATLPQRDNAAISVRKPSIKVAEPDVISSVENQREKLYRELAEEFNTFDRLANLVRRVSQLVKPSVVHIEAHKSEEKDGHKESYDEAGSGIIVEIENQVWVLTNRHVIMGADTNQIMLRSNDGREYHPSKILGDPNTDVAVMRVQGLDLPQAKMGDSLNTEIGDFVIAIGSPFGLSHSVTFGILSAKGRRDLSLGDQRIELQDFFQTDAAINPGNSGGPLLNLRGEVVGLNTAIASSSGGSEGIGFAIPINMAMQVAQQLVRYGKLRRGYLGVTLDPDFTPASTSKPNVHGALVKSVRAGSPAEIAHLQRGDVVVEFNGHVIDNDDHLVARVGLTEIGSKIPMIIQRDGRLYRTEVVLTDLN